MLTPAIVLAVARIHPGVESYTLDALEAAHKRARIRAPLATMTVADLRASLALFHAEELRAWEGDPYREVVREGHKEAAAFLADEVALLAAHEAALAVINEIIEEDGDYTAPGRERARLGRAVAKALPL
jgi:hypothetical protein